MTWRTRLPACLAATVFACSAARADMARRLFDFTPLSSANPAVATIDDTIAIPLSELRTYRDTERLAAVTAAGDTADRAKLQPVLDDLINEYLLVDETYRDGVPDSKRFQQQMDATRTMILTDFLATRIRDEALVKSPADAATAANRLADQLFDEASIEVSNEAYDIVKHGADLIDQARDGSGANPTEGGDSAGPSADTVARFRAILAAAPEAVAVRYEGHSLSIHQILGLYAGIPAPRPAIGTPDGFLAMIKPFITPELMAMEAVRRGIESEPEFQHKLIQNRNALLRFHAHGLVEARANDILNGPELDGRLNDWYQEHQDAFARTAPDGSRSIPALATVRPQVLADFSVDLCERLLAEKLAALRAEHRVRIDETAFDRL